MAPEAVDSFPLVDTHEALADGVVNMGNPSDMSVLEVARDMGIGISFRGDKIPDGVAEGVKTGSAKVAGITPESRSKH
jgi:hypothetical protein